MNEAPEAEEIIWPTPPRRTVAECLPPGEIGKMRARIAGLEKERAAFLALLAPFADAHRAVEAMPYPMRYSFGRNDLIAARIAVDDAIALELARAI